MNLTVLDQLPKPQPQTADFQGDPASQEQAYFVVLDFFDYYSIDLALILD